MLQCGQIKHGELNLTRGLFLIIPNKVSVCKWRTQAGLQGLRSKLETVRASEFAETGEQLACIPDGYRSVL